MRRAAVILVFATATLAGAAELYKWTDTDGQVHFSDAPPAGVVKLEKLSIKSAPTDAKLLESLDVQKGLRDKQAAMEGEVRAKQEQRAAEEAAAKQQACEAARKRYDGVKFSRKFVTAGSDGKEAWMSGADADKMKADLKAAADKACEGN